MGNEPKIVVGEMIRYLLHENNMTMKELGSKLGKTESTVSKWISGASTPMAKQLSEMTQIFSVDLNTLLYGADFYRTNNKIGETIKKLRCDNGLSIADLAKALNTTESSIISYEKDLKKLDLDVLSSLADHFKVTTDFLLGRSVDAVKDDINNEINLLFDDISNNVRHLTQLDREVIHKLANVYLNNKEKIHLDFE